MRTFLYHDFDDTELEKRIEATEARLAHLHQKEQAAFSPQLRQEIESLHLALDDFRNELLSRAQAESVNNAADALYRALFPQYGGDESVTSVVASSGDER